MDSIKMIVGYLFILVVSNHILYIAIQPYFTSKIHMQTNADPNHSEISDGSIIDIADLKISSVYLHIYFYLLKDFYPLHCLFLFFLIKQLLEILIPLLDIGHLIDLLELVIKPNSIYYLIIDILKHCYRYIL